MLPGAEEATNCERLTAMERDTLRPQLAGQRSSQFDPFQSFDASARRNNRSYAFGGMFTFKWNTLSGSYFALIDRSRWTFGPYAAVRAAASASS